LRRLFVIPAVAAAIVALLALPTSAIGAPLLQISSDPFTNPLAQHRTEVEPDTFVWGNTWVSTFQVGRVFSGGASDIGFATSTNGGATFTSGFLPGTTTATVPNGIYQRVSDPSVAYDAKHGVWLTSYLGLFPHENFDFVDVLVSRSTDGINWSAPVTVAHGNYDKNWTVCDNTASSPFYGHCYTEFDDVSKFDLEQMSTSTDGGSTWAPPLATANHIHGLGGQPVVQPNGTVIVPFQGFSDVSLFIRSFRSTDGGASWSSSVTVAELRTHNPRGDLRAPQLPSAEIDASGKVYVTWSDCRFEASCRAPFNNAPDDLVLSTSTDGLSWSPPARIPLDPVGSSVDHFLPGLGVDRSTSGSSARLGLVYYYYPNFDCTTATCRLDAGFSSSLDGGATWTPGTRLAGPMRNTWLPLTSQGYMVGDYFSTSFLGGRSYPAFAVASPPSSGGSSCIVATPNCNQPMFTVAGGLGSSGATSAAVRARSPRVGAGRTEIAVPTAR
jgi:BNR repeat-like domain